MEKSKLDQLRIERGPEKSAPRWLIWTVLAVVVLAAGAWAAKSWLDDTAIEVSTAQVRQVSSAAGGTILNASGYVTARRQATVSSKFTGRVEEVLIEEGMLVEEGQVLARLDSANINASLALARAQAHSSESSLEETRALLSEAQANLLRTQQLVTRKLASAAELDRVRALSESLEAQLERKRADLEVSRRQVDIYLQQIEDTIIRAPFEGVIVAKNAQPGEMISPVSAGGGFTRTGIGTIVDMNSLEIEIDVNEAYINRVQAGQAVVATLDAYPDWPIPCRVIAIIPTADRQRATVEVRVGFEELDPRILPDMGVKVAFQDQAPSAVASHGIIVPDAALRRDGDQPFVFVWNAGVAERRALRLGERSDSGFVVEAGLSSGERIITAAPAELADGMAIREKAR